MANYNSITNNFTIDLGLEPKANRFIAADRGSAIEPSFSIQEDVGIYSSSAGILSFAVSGTTPLFISSTVTSNLPVVAPNYSLGDSKIYASAGLLDIDVAGSKIFETTNALSKFYGDVEIKGDLLSSTDLLIKTNGSDRLTIGSTLTSQVQFLNQSGTVALPAYSFSGDVDTGIYRESDGKFSLSCNATKVMTFTDTQVYFYVGTTLTGFFNDGSAAAPSISFTNDNTTGFYRTGPVCFSYLGTKYFELSSQIKTSDGSAASPTYSFINSASTGMYSPAANNIGWSISGTSKLTMSSTILESKNRFKIPNSTAAFPAIYSDDSVGWTSGLYSLDNANGQIGFSISGNPTLYSDASKNTSTLSFRNINGSVSTPSYSFSSYTNSGIYNNAGVLSFSNAGVNMMWMSNPVVGINGLVRAPDSANQYAPCYSFQTNTQSGMYLGVDFLGFSYNSNPIFNVSTNGITNIGYCRSDSFYFRNDTDTGIQNDTANEIDFYAGGILKASFNYNGALKFNGQMQLNYGSEASPAYAFQSTTNSGMYLYTNTPPDLRISSSGSNCASFRNKKIHAFKDTSVSVPTITWDHDPTTGLNSWISGGINFISGGTERVQLGSSYLIPAYNNGISLGLSGYAWSSCLSYAFLNASDRRLKSDIEDCELGLDFINRITPRKYRWNGRVRKHRGFIAQEIKEVCDEMKVSGTEADNIGFWYDNSINTPVTNPIQNIDDSQGLSYIEFIPILAKAIQEITQKLHNLGIDL